MEISVENAGPFKSVRLYGRLDSKGAGTIFDAIVGLGSLGPGKVFVSMGAVSQATRAGSSALIVAAKMLRAKTGEKLLVYDASQEVTATIEGLGYNHLIEILPSSEVQSHFAAQLSKAGVI